MNNSQFIQKSLDKNLGQLSAGKALVVSTGNYTGRIPKNRFIVRSKEISDQIDWSSSANNEISEDLANKIFATMKSKLRDTKNCMKGFVGPFAVEVSSTSAWHIAFCINMFREKPISKLIQDVKSHTLKIYHMPDTTLTDLNIEFEKEVVVIIDFYKGILAVVGTGYAGEIKKGAFTYSNFWLPHYKVLSMHSSANCLNDGSNSCVLFGLSGTGKTTLSVGDGRSLVGDDEIVWSNRGLSNLEGGCYAKLIRLDQKKEPDIYSAVNRPGSIQENVVMDDNKKINFDDCSITENTRGSYSLDKLSNVFDQKQESFHPNNIVFLTADAFGALPIVAKLNYEQAQYHFISGYTSKVAGTEVGIIEPELTFSACFGLPFMPRYINDYAKLLKEKAEKNKCNIWLLNTGWMAGGYGKSDRYPIVVSRKILQAIHSGELVKQKTVFHPIFNFQVPVKCPEVPQEFMDFSSNKQSEILAEKFNQNIKKYSKYIDKNIIDLGGPIRKIVDEKDHIPQVSI